MLSNLEKHSEKVKMLKHWGHYKLSPMLIIDIGGRIIDETGDRIF
ncbi:MAG: hypothetical protein K0R80_2533 [Clostridia bacterium]|jgi:hypothetical protein|nr:hypothetical protein [Clostridia bacterium]